MEWLLLQHKTKSKMQLIVRNKILFALYLILKFQIINGQSPYLKYFNTKNGLLSNTTFETLQDRYGYLWISTDKGISRFDGRNFKNYTSDDGLPDKTIYGFLEDSKGRIWFKTMNGKLGYYFQGFIYNQKNFNLLSKAEMGGTIYNILEDSMGRIWFIGEKIILLNNSKIEVFDERNLPSSKVKVNHKNPTICSAVLDISGNLIYIDRWNQMFRYYNNMFHEIKNNGEINKLKNGERSVFKSKHGFCYMVSKSFILKFDNNFNIICKKPIYEISKIYSITITKDELYISTDKGLLRLDHSLKEIHRYLVNKNINYTLKDNNGSLWLSTPSHGLIMFPDNTSIFYNCEFFQNQVVHRFKKVGKQMICVTTEGEIFSLDSTKCMIIKKNHIKEVAYNIYEKNGHYFIVFPNEILTSDAKSSKIFKQFKNLPLKTLFIDNNEDVYIGSYIIFKVKGGNNPQKISFKRINRTYDFERVGNKLFAATENGLYIIKDDGKTILVKGTSYFNTCITQMMKSDSNTLWMATKNKGLIIKRDNISISLNLKNGLSNNIDRIAVNDRKAYISSGNNIFEILFVKGKRIIQVKSIKLLPNIGNELIHDLYLDNNKLWIALESGILIYNLKNNYPSKRITPVLIDELFINNKRFELKKEIVLNYNQNNVFMNFSSANLNYFGQLQYRIRRKSNELWSIISSGSFNLLSVEPGNYSFEIQARVPNGIWSESGDKITLIIKNPYWKEWWFITGIGFMIIFIIFFYIRERFSKYKKLQKLKIDYLNSELYALRSNMNPHFIFNSLNSIQEFILNNDSKEASKYLLKFSTLIRKTLEHSRKDKVTLENEIEFLRNYITLEQFRSKNSFDFKITIDEDIDTSTFDIPSMLFQPLVENAVHHGIKNLKDGLIQIKFEKSNEDLIFSIIDNGIGIKNSQKNIHSHKSVAMDIILSRIEKYNVTKEFKIDINIEEMNFEDILRKGTKIKVVFYDYFQ